MDFLSSSSDDEKKPAAAALHGLDDSSTDDKSMSRLSENKPICSTINDLSSQLRTVNIDAAVLPKKDTAATTTCIDLCDLESSSNDEDRIIETHERGRRRIRQPIIVEISDSSPERVVSTTKIKGVDQTGRKSSKKDNDKAKRQWRLSTSRGEYTVSDISRSDCDLPNFRIPSLLFDKLYNHQKEGVAWMVGLHSGGVGGLLG